MAPPEPLPLPLPRTADVVVVGAGIVGLAVAEALTRRHARAAVVVLDKEDRIAAHQTGHNSGVLHSGIYYEPGSLKARTATAGREAMVRFAAEHGIAHEVCGKVVVAVDRSEVPALDELERRGVANGLRVRRIDAAELHELEPHANGVAALHVPETGIIDFVAVCERLRQLIEERGGQVALGTAVTTINGATVETTQGPITATERIVNCAGLHSDRVAAMTTDTGGVRIVPFRGEYYDVVPHRTHLCNNLIYPVPDPRFPFLGVHLTRSVHGGIHAGPNAVLALAREGYRRRTVNGRDTWELLTNPAVRTLAKRYWRTGAGEVHRSLSKRAFVHALQRLVPDLRADDLLPTTSGVRAQALEATGDLVDDFRFADGPNGNVVNVLNAPSPAATAALEIAEHVAARLAIDD
jgi:L-2-hydroxyglutarate oxidase LhgO